MSGEADDADRGEDRLELLGDEAVDEEVGGEVEHDKEVGDALQAHDPPGRDVLVQQLHARHLHICNTLIASVQCHCHVRAVNKPWQSLKFYNHALKHYAKQPASLL